MSKFIELNKENEYQLVKDLTKGNVRLVPIIGKNGSGKTKILKSIIKEAKKDNTVIVIKAEFDQRKIIENFEEYINILLENEDKELFIEKYKKSLPNGDENFNEWFRNYLSFDRKQSKIIANLDVKKSKIPSGIFLYSLLISLSSIIKNLKDKRGVNKFLIIDEIEKYTHKTLAIKIANVISELIKKDINVIFTTHSSIILKEIWHEYCLLLENSNIFTKSKLKFDILFMKSKIVENENKIFFKKITKDNLYHILKGCTIREQSIIFETFFSENNILVEGIKDKELVDAILRKKFKYKYCDTHDCNGKGPLLKINKVLMEFNVSDTFILFDGDINKNNANISFNEYYFRFPVDIETSLNLKRREKGNISELNWKTIDKVFQGNDDYIELVKKIKKYLERK